GRDQGKSAAEQPRHQPLALDHELVQAPGLVSGLERAVDGDAGVIQVVDGDSRHCHRSCGSGRIATPAGAALDLVPRTSETACSRNYSGFRSVCAHHGRIGNYTHPKRERGECPGTLARASGEYGSSAELTETAVV